MTFIWKNCTFFSKFIWRRKNYFSLLTTLLGCGRNMVNLRGLCLTVTTPRTIKRKNTFWSREVEVKYEGAFVKSELKAGQPPLAPWLPSSLAPWLGLTGQIVHARPAEWSLSTLLPANPHKCTYKIKSQSVTGMQTNSYPASSNITRQLHSRNLKRYNYQVVSYLTNNGQTKLKYNSCRRTCHSTYTWMDSPQCLCHWRTRRLRHKQRQSYIHK